MRGRKFHMFIPKKYENIVASPLQVMLDDRWHVTKWVNIMFHLGEASTALRY